MICFRERAIVSSSRSLKNDESNFSSNCFVVLSGFLCGSAQYVNCFWAVSSVWLIFVIPVVSSSILAKRMEQCGADAVVAEGTESGGHVGEMTTMALVPTVVDSVSIPVIAAGGIADGRQLLAAFALGAVGVQLGTCLLASTECPIHPAYKEAVLKAKDNDTVVTGRIAGTPVRIIKNTMAREYVKQEKAGADKMELEKFTLGSLRRAVFEGDVKTGSLMAGQVVGQIDEIKPVAEIFKSMYEGYDKLRKQLADAE